jgi:hypothetical protein
MRATLALVAALLLAAPAMAQDAACDARWQVAEGQETMGQMEARANTPCSISISVGGTRILDGLRILDRADNGIAGIAGRRIAYSPRAGFRGRDTFIVEVAWLEGGTRRSGRVRMIVNVR